MWEICPTLRFSRLICSDVHLNLGVLKDIFYSSYVFFSTASFLILSNNLVVLEASCFDRNNLLIIESENFWLVLLNLTQPSEILLTACNHTIERVPLTLSYHLQFLSVSEDCNMLHYGLVGRVQKKECYFMFTYTFLPIFLLFSSKKIDFIIFISSINKVSNFHERILPNQKQELVIKITKKWAVIDPLSSESFWKSSIHYGNILLSLA